jgi:hypothetical protein
MQTHIITWNSIQIRITFQPNRFAGYDHLEIETEERGKGGRPALPLTNTSYKSHFAPHGEIEHHGGPVTYVKDALNEAEQSPEWQRHLREEKEREEAARQLSFL